MQVPTVGRIVHYFPSKEVKYAGKQPMAALVTYVNDDGSAVVRVSPPVGAEFTVQEITIIPHPGAEPAAGRYCEWPPLMKPAAPVLKDQA